MSAPSNTAATSADASTIRNFLHAVSRRLTTIAAAQGAAVGCGVAVVYTLVRWSSPQPFVISFGIALVITVVTAIVAVMVSVKRRRSPALIVERAATCHNLVVSANELIANPTRASSGMNALVQQQAAQIIRGLNVDTLFPKRTAGIMLVAGALILAASIALRSAHATSVSVRAQQDGTFIPSIDQIDVSVTAPAYTGRAPQTLRNPARIEALAGSIVQLTIHAAASSVTVETLLGKQTLALTDQKTFTGNVTADADGFIAIEPSTAAGKIGTRKLIGMSVTPDRAPHVRVTAPGHDLLFPDGDRSLDVAIDADDDLALGTLKLRYTRVSGSGERYTFTEGELPIEITRSSDTKWQARAHWDLRSLNLTGGDMVVYRAAATDRHPGAPVIESDSYIAEIHIDGGDAAAGFAVDPEQDRYALSQQMIIVKTERLLAKKSTLTTQAFADEANDIATEQRRVRAEFVFMMGGELADIPDAQEDMTTLHEEYEANSEADILDGRGANTGRLALVRAVRAMSGAVRLLNTTAVPEALVRERTALVQLERAFSHTRKLLRALTVAERLDLSRRMTGPLLDVGRDQHPNPIAEVNARVVALRRALAGVAELSASNGNLADASARASELAERVLRVDPSAKALQAIAKSLNEVGLAFGNSQLDDARRSLEKAAVNLTTILRAEVITAPQRTRSFEADRLDGALADALRGARGLK